MKIIENYELRDTVGSGGQGVVWRARVVADTPPRLRAGETVAIKMLNADLRKPRMALLEFEHDAIVRYKDIFLAEHGLEKRWFIVMEFVEGETLEQRLARFPHGLPWPEARRILRQCIEACAYAHKKGIIHRDLKPHNVMLPGAPADPREDEIRVKLIDFDIARDENKTGATKTQTQVAGSFDYMAPECFMQADFRGDTVSEIFSFGVMCHRTLGGRLPFGPVEESGGMAALIERWRNPAAPPPPCDRGTFRALERTAADVVRKCLAAERAQRFQSFEELGEAFDSIRARSVEGAATYELTGFLGSGGAAAVYSGRRLPDVLPVAVKRPKPGGLSRRETDRFLREAEVLRQYPHDHIVKFIDFIRQPGGEDDARMLVMEKLENAPHWCLHHRIRDSRGGLPPGETIRLFIHYAEALHYIHEHGFIHRDIKPDNLYAPPGNPAGAKLFDMGVVRSLRGTQTIGGIPGTFDYMAPELAGRLGERGSRASDIYALGFSLYAALTGNFPFQPFDNDFRSACLQLLERAKGRRDSVKDIDFSAACFTTLPELRFIIRKALAFNPANRFQTADAMRQALQTALRRLSGGPITDEVLAAHEAGTDAIPGTPLPAPDDGAPEAGTPDKAAVSFAEYMRLLRVRAWLWRVEHAGALLKTAAAIAAIPAVAAAVLGARLAYDRYRPEPDATPAAAPPAQPQPPPPLVPPPRLTSRLEVVPPATTEPQWPRVRAVASGADRAISIGQTVVAGIVTLSNRWGDSISYRVSDSTRDPPVEETFTLHLRAGPGDGSEVERLTGLIANAPLTSWYEAKERWAPYMSPGLVRELEISIRAVEDATPLTASLKLLSDGDGPRWPGVVLTGAGPGEKVFVDNIEITTNHTFELTGHPWGTSIEYQVRRGAGQPNRLALQLEPPGDIKLFCGLPPDAGQDAVAQAAGQWKQYLAESLYNELIAAARPDECELFLRRLSFMDFTGAPYQADVSAKALEFGKICRANGHAGAAGRMTNFWWRVFHDAAAKHEFSIQRGALRQLARLNVPAASFTPGMLALPMAATPGGAYIAETNNIAMRFAMTAGANRSEAFAADAARPGHYPAAAILPSALDLEIRYEDNDRGIANEWKAALVLAPDGICGMSGPGGATFAHTNQTPFYILRSELPLEAMRLAQRWIGMHPAAKAQWPGLAAPIIQGRGVLPFGDATERIAMEFCAWMNERFLMPNPYAGENQWDRGFRLPTGMEWQFAAQYGHRPEFWRELSLKMREHPRSVSDLVFFSQFDAIPMETTADGRTGYALGLQDMCGNVWELTHEARPGGVRARGGSLRATHPDGVMPWIEKSVADARGPGQEPVGIRLVLPMPVFMFEP